MSPLGRTVQEQVNFFLKQNIYSVRQHPTHGVTARRQSNLKNDKQLPPSWHHHFTFFLEN